MYICIYTRNIDYISLYIYIYHTIHMYIELRGRNIHRVAEQSFQQPAFQYFV